MKNIRIFVLDREYASYIFTDQDLDKVIELPEIRPLEHKLFSGDVFEISDTNDEKRCKIHHSPLRQSSQFAGVLQLHGNKTFGRTENKKRLLYKCIPDDKHLPVFLVPYEVKVGFSKTQKNKYVLFRYENWSEKHPRGMLVETLGDVDHLPSFYEYQLYCKNLHESMVGLTSKTKSVVHQKSHEEHVVAIKNNPDFCVEDRRDEYIFTIDPKGSTDFDDGFSIKKLDHGWKVSVYIANVFVWIETFGLWNSLSNRVATIYLPDRRRPMLPSILSDTLCSLQEKQERFAFAVDFTINENEEIVSDVSCQNVLIKISKNFHYEEPELVNNNAYYSRLLDITQRLDKHVENSHDVVAHWMVQMNHRCASILSQKKKGIFRSMAYINSPTLTADKANLSSDTVRIINTWNNTIGQYLLYKDQDEALQHQFMNLKTYIHITSPIRRLVDILNQMILFRELGVVKNLSKDGLEFLDKWTNKMDFVNSSMRSVRKIQIDCEVLSRCFRNDDILKNTHSGVVFDKVVRNDGMNSYMVYLEDLKLLSRMNCTEDLKNHSKYNFRVYFFENEDQTRKKIRLSLA